MDILSYLNGFEEHLMVLLGRSSGTVKRYCRTVESFSDWINSRGVEGGMPRTALSITQGDIEAWLKDLYYHQGNLQNISRASKLSALKAFWKYLEYKGVIDDNPLRLVPSPKISRPLPQKFSTFQLRQIFAGPDLSTPMGIRDMAILKVLYGSGPRVDEVRNLNLDDLHYNGRDIYLHYHITKGGKERVVHLRRNPSEALMRWSSIRERFTDPRDPDSARSLFVSMSNNTPGCRMSVHAYNAVLKKYSGLVGLNSERVFVHKMRSTFATDLYDLGFGIIEISHLMGHRSVETTQWYIAISDSALKKTAIPDKRWRELERGTGDEKTAGE